MECFYIFSYALWRENRERLLFDTSRFQIEDAIALDGKVVDGKPIEGSKTFGPKGLIIMPADCLRFHPIPFDPADGSTFAVLSGFYPEPSRAIVRLIPSSGDASVLIEAPADVYGSDRFQFALKQLLSAAGIEDSGPIIRPGGEAIDTAGKRENVAVLCKK